MIKLFASDMDGTLLNDTHIISERAAKAIKTLQQQGIVFMIATGRDECSARILLEPHDIQCPLICLNGAAMYDEQGQLCYSQPLNKKDVQQMMDYLYQHDLNFGFQTQNGFYTADFEDFKERVAKFIDVDTANDLTNAQLKEQFGHTYDVKEYNGTDDVLKLMVFSEFSDKLAHFQQTFQSNPDIDITASSYDNCEITHRLAQKGLAIERYIQERGWTMQQVASIGDSFNDRSMLQMASYSFAMDNAMEPVKQLAKYLAPSNADEGVARIIEQFIEQTYDFTHNPNH